MILFGCDQDLSEEQIIESLLLAKSSLDVLLLRNLKNVSMEILKTQYKKLSLLIHPDKWRDNRANECFVKLKEAFDDISLKFAQRQSDSNSSDGCSIHADNRFKSGKRRKRNNSDLFNDSPTEKFDLFNEIVTDDMLASHSTNWNNFKKSKKR